MSTLYVIFHGLWAFETQPDKILAHTCIEVEHDIVAGFIDFSKLMPASTVDLIPGECKLLGIDPQPQTTNIFDSNLNVIIQNKSLRLASKRFCVIELPLPKRIESRRSPAPDDPPTIPYGGIDGEKLKPIKVSLVQVFLYDVADPASVRLSPPDVGPKVDPATNTAKLHIFAEPSNPMFNLEGRLHVRDAYSKLALLFGLDIVPLAPAFEAASDPGLPGLIINDMLNLGEALSMSIEAGTSGSNCDALVIDNTALK
jgi:hypothetical protein